MVPQLRLQHKQWLAGALIVTCCLLLGGSSFLQHLRADRQIDATLREVERFNAVIDLLNSIIFERGRSNIALTSDFAEPVVQAQLVAAREEADRDFEATIEAFAGSRDAAELRWSLEEARRRLVRARSLVDTTLAIPSPKRENDRVRGAMDALLLALDSAKFPRDRIGQTIVSLQPNVIPKINLAVAASELRDQAGRLGAYTLEALRAGSDANPERDMRAYMTVGRLYAIRDVIRSLSGVAKSDPTVSNVIWSVDNEFYSMAIPRTTLIYANARTEKAITAAEFARIVQEDLQKIQNMRETVALWSFERLVAMRNQARIGVVRSAFLTILGTLIVITMSISLRRLLFLPLTAARSQISAITKGDLSDPAAVNPATPEMREMFQSLSNLRSDQRFRRQVENDQRRMASRLKQLSETDMLTGLLNRRAFEEAARLWLQQAGVTGETIGLILFDLDHFKTINDGRGHAAGDAVLHGVASGLPPYLPESAIFARFGGEEFVILLTGPDAETSLAVAERVHEALRSIELPSLPGLRVTGSFGVAVRRSHDDLDLGALLEIADRRLYAAKNAGRDRVCGNDGHGEALGEAADSRSHLVQQA